MATEISTQNDVLNRLVLLKKNKLRKKYNNNFTIMKKNSEDLSYQIKPFKIKHTLELFL